MILSWMSWWEVSCESFTLNNVFVFLQNKITIIFICCANIRNGCLIFYLNCLKHVSLLKELMISRLTLYKFLSEKAQTQHFRRNNFPVAVRCRLIKIKSKKNSKTSRSSCETASSINSEANFILYERAIFLDVAHSSAQNSMLYLVRPCSNRGRHWPGNVSEWDERLHTKWGWHGRCYPCATFNVGADIVTNVDAIGPFMIPSIVFASLLFAILFLCSYRSFSLTWMLKWCCLFILFLLNVGA